MNCMQSVENSTSSIQKCNLLKNANELNFFVHSNKAWNNNKCAEEEAQASSRIKFENARLTFPAPSYHTFKDANLKGAPKLASFRCSQQR